MPTYAYRCGECGEAFELSASLSQLQAETPSCPKCGSGKVQWTPSRFVALTGKKS
jgi:putative FmdB family regulatory protein